jgi:NAD dependent epimerase/dehydratase
MKILVTGSDGFIGSNLVNKLVNKGHNITALCQYNSLGLIGNLDFLEKKIKDGINIIHGDIRDKDFIEKIVKKHDVIFHLAALVGIPYSYHSYYSYVDTNVLGTLNILSAMKKNLNSYLIHTSTSEVYGSAQYVPIDENHPLAAQSPYAATKISADQIVNSFTKSFSLNSCIIRPFNTFGPGQSPRAIIPTVIIQSLSKNKKIFLGNLNTIRDLTFVDDTVEGFYLCLKKLKKINGETINLGAGKGYLIKDIVKKIIKITNSSSEIVIQNERIRPKNSEVIKLISCNSKAKKIIGWKPIYVSSKNFEIALKKTVSWYDENKIFYSNSKKYNV